MGQALPQPDAGESEIEIRPVFEPEDFGEGLTRPRLRAARKMPSGRRSPGVTSHESREHFVSRAQRGTNMKYMLLIYMTDDAMTDAERQACYHDSAAALPGPPQERQFLGANPLHPTSTATSVRVRDCRPSSRDGPFAETREHLGGYFSSWSPNLDGADSRIAGRIPGARKGTVEIVP